MTLRLTKPVLESGVRGREPYFADDRGGVTFACAGTSVTSAGLESVKLPLPLVVRVSSAKTTCFSFEAGEGVAIAESRKLGLFGRRRAPLVSCNTGGNSSPRIAAEVPQAGDADCDVSES